MARRLEVLAAAADEAVAAASWYFERSPDAAAAFDREVRRGFEQIGRLPETWPVYRDEARRFLLSRFPYEIVYRVYPDVILVVAVAHCKRKPGYWKTR